MTDRKTPEELGELFAAAAAIAERVPEALRAVAFQRALDQLLGAADESRASNTPQQEPAVRGSARDTGQADTPDRVDQLLDLLDRTEHADVMARGRVLDKALLVLRAAHHHGIEQLTPAEIAKVLTEKFRERTSDAAVRMALGSDASFTDRRREGQGYAYRLMAAGERYLSNPEPPTSTPSQAQPKQIKSRASRRSGHRSTTTDAPGKVARQSSGRPGPKRMIEDLIGQGFFDQARDIGAVIDHVQQKRGYRYKATDLSPALARLLREGRLDRERDDKGQYQYKRRA